MATKRNRAYKHASRIPARSKYRAIKVKYDGHTFDSKAEYYYYLQLKDRVARHEITDLEVHPVVTLQDRAKDFAGRNVAPITWKLDFAYYDRTGKHWYEDVKGVKTQAYLLKVKMFLARFTSVCYAEIPAATLYPRR